MTAPRMSEQELERLYQEYLASKNAPADPFKPTRTPNAAPRDASQTAATTTNVQGAPNDWAGAIRTVGQGVSFKFGDELEAGIRRVVPFVASDKGKNYDDIVRDVRGSVDQFGRDNPKTAALLEASGALISGGLAGKALGAGKTALSAWDAAKTAGAGGAIAGGVAGVGGGTNMDERIRGGITGAIVGGAVGGAVGGGGHKIVEKLAERGTDRPTRIIVNAMRDDRVDPIAARAALADAPDMVSLADLGGDATRRLAGTSTLTPTANGAALRDAMGKRSLQAGEDFSGLVQSATNIPRENVNTAQATMKAMRKQTSGPLFEAATQSGPVQDARLVKLVSVSPEAQTAYQGMVRTAQRREIAVPTLDEFIGGSPLDARAAHWWKLEMDGIKNAVAKQAKTAEGGMTTTTAAQVADDAKALRNTLGDVIPGYGDALKTYAKASGEMRAYKMALKGSRNQNGVESMPSFTRAKSEDAQTFTSALPDNERQMFTRGAVQDLARNTEDGTAAARKITRVLDLPSEQAKYRTLFDPGASGDEAFKRFMARGGIQRNQRLVEDEVIGNSKTAARSAAAQTLNGEAGVIEDAATRGSLPAAIQSKVLRYVAKRRLGSASDKVAETMLPKTKAELDALLESYLRLQSTQMGKLPTTRGALRSGAVVGNLFAPSRERP